MEDKKEYYLTPETIKKLQKELDNLKQLKKDKAEKGTPSMLHSEDVNPEYLAFMEDFELLESRIYEIEDILRKAKPLSLAPKKEGEVTIGSTVVVEVNGKKDEFLIVESIEADPSRGKISYLSPVGKALLGRKKEERVEISSPVKIVYIIKDIRYDF